MSNEDSLTASLDLLRRLPPQSIESNLDLLVNILPDLADDLLSSVDQPLKVQVDDTAREYLVRRARSGGLHRRVRSGGGR
ncbi:hypothetical protein JCM21900_002180 [Sporobolomyces salmonicolor]